MEVTGWGGRRSDRQRTGKEERWQTRRKKERTRGREEGTGSRGAVWSRREAGRERKRIYIKTLVQGITKSRIIFSMNRNSHTAEIKTTRSSVADQQKTKY